MTSATVLDLVIADDHAMFRQGIVRLFAGVDDMQIVAETDNGDDLIGLIGSHNPAAALVDVSMPGPGPVGIVEQVEALGVSCKLVALTMHLEPSYAETLLEAGMSGYVIKDAAFDELLDAVHTVLAGDQYLSMDLLDVPSSLPVLTAREIECLKAAASGETGNAIGDALGISERTVRFHLANICRKFGVQRRSQAIALAHRHNML